MERWSGFSGGLSRNCSSRTTNFNYGSNTVVQFSGCRIKKCAAFSRNVITAESLLHLPFNNLAEGSELLGSRKQHHMQPAHCVCMHSGCIRSLSLAPISQFCTTGRTNQQAWSWSVLEHSWRTLQEPTGWQPAPGRTS